MRLKLSKEWYQGAGKGEEGLRVTAGLPSPDRLVAETSQYRSNLGRKHCHQVSFARFVNLIRRANQLTIDTLARKANIDPAELYNIEIEPDVRVEAATVSKLAAAFHLSRARMVQFANLTPARVSRVREAGVEFTADAEKIASLTDEENAILREELAYLGEP